MPFEAGKIRAMSLGIFKHDEKILVIPGYDNNKNEHFYRLPGGGIDFGETSKEALRREMREEFDAEISNVQFLEVAENIFSFNEQKGHEIIFLFEGNFSDKNFYKQETIILKDSDGKYSAEWVLIEKFRSGKETLYPTMNNQCFDLFLKRG